MPKLQPHWYCPKGIPTKKLTLAGREILVPMGDIKTIYHCKGKRWVKIGTLCLHCLEFIPQDRNIN